jgi:hypothetical protein
MVDGKQYVALMGGSGGTASLGVTNPGAANAPMKPHLVVFGLDGKAELPKAGGPAAPPSDPH